MFLLSLRKKSISLISFKLFFFCQMQKSFSLNFFENLCFFDFQFLFIFFLFSAEIRSKMHIEFDEFRDFFTEF